MKATGNPQLLSVQRLKRGFVLSLSLTILQTIVLNHADGSKVDNVILDRYRPFAMDETVTVDGASYPLSSGHEGGFRNSRSEQLSNTMVIDSVGHQDLDDQGPLLDAPLKADSSLTKLIANGGRNPPTFVMRNLSMPSEENAGRRDEYGNEILSSYKVLIPIYVPSVSRKLPRPKQPEEPIQFVKEVVNEMVPVTQTVPYVKEVIRPERLREKVTTDYVEVKDKNLPKKIDVSVLPNEKLITSTVNILD